MSKMEYGNAVKSFMAMDLDGDGYLSIEEFRSSLGLLGIDDSFAQILFNSFAKAEHHDRDGFINRSEFCASMAVMLHPTRVEEQVSMAFDAYDLNHDGKLSLEELESVITAMFAAMVKMRIRRPDEHPTAALAAVDLFRHMDAEDKGYVTKEDYLRLATTNPELLKKLGLGSNRNLKSQSKGRQSIEQQQRVAASPGGGPSGGVSGGASGGQLGSLFGVPHRVKRGRGGGSVVAFGHQNWELVVQMMVAIRLAVDHAIQLAKKSAMEQSSARSMSGVSVEMSSLDGGGGGGGGGGGSSGGSSGGGSGNGDGGASSGVELMRQDDSAIFYTADDHVLSPAMYKYVWREDIPGSWKGKKASTAFKDYAPLVFRRIRLLFGVSDRDYMLSLGPEQILGELLLGNMGSLSELFSEGKSGSFFYFTNDGAYVIKTIPHRELLSLVRLLPQYVRHVEDQPNTLLPRFMGAHRIHMPGGRKVHFIVMTNVFSSPRIIHERFDLKGSTLGRTAGKALEEHPDLVRKDLDVKAPFALKPASRDLLLTQIIADLGLLRQVRTMDYSLLVGVHYPGRDGSLAPEDISVRLSLAAEPSESPAPSPLPPPDATSPDRGKQSTVRLAKAGLRRVRPPWYDDSDGAMFGQPVGGAAAAAAAAAAGEGEGDDDPPEESVFFIGVIDILTAWTWAKSAENFFKTLLHPHRPDSHSCVPPLRYAKRFQRHLRNWLGTSTGTRAE